MKKNITYALIIGVVALVSVVAMSQVNGDNSCSDPRAVLTANILSDGANGGGALAIVQNNSDCSFNVGLDAFLTSTNAVYDSIGTVVGPWGVVELHINVPDCQYLLQLSSDSTILDSRTVRSNVCPGNTPTSTVTPTPTPGVTPAPCTTGNIQINVDGPQSAAYFITRPDGSTFGWNGSKLFTGQASGAGYSLRADSIAGYNTPTVTSSNGDTVPACGTVTATITYTVVSTPTVTQTPTPTPTPTSCPNGNVVVNVVGPQSASYYITRPNGSTFGWNGTKSFADQTAGTYSLRADTISGFQAPVITSSTGSSLACGGQINYTITYTAISSPTPTQTPTPTPTACPNGNVIVNVVGPQSAAYYITRPNGSTFGWNGSKTFSGQTPGAYSLRADTVSGFSAPVINSTGSSFTCGGQIVYTVTYNAVATPTPTPTSCPNGNIAVTVVGPQSAAYFITRPNGSTFGWNGTKSFPDQTAGTYALRADTISGFNTPVITSTGSSLACSGQLAYTVTYTAVATSATPTPTPAATATPTPAQTQVINTNTNTTTTSTSTTTNINQTGNCNIAFSTSSTANCNINTAAAIVPIPVPNAVLSLSKMVRNISGNSSESKSVNANVNDTVEFIIRVSASGNTQAGNVRVTDSLPYGLSYVAGSTTIDNFTTNDGLTSGGLNLGTFYAGRLATLRFRATVSQQYYGYNQSNTYPTYSNAVTLTNSATATADLGSPVTDSASVFVNASSQPVGQTLSVQKTGRNITRGDNTQRTSLTGLSGDGIEFTIVVTAPYGTNLSNVLVSDQLPAGMTYTNQSTTLNNVVIGNGIVSGGLNIGSLSAGQSATIKFYATINQGLTVNQQLVNTAAARADNVAQVLSNPVYITIGNVSVVKGALDVRTGPAGMAFGLSGFGALISSAAYYARRKGLASLIKFV